MPTSPEMPLKQVMESASSRMVTGSKFDVQFADLGARYAFGVAAFDNAQVRHATSDDLLFPVFAK